MIAHRFRNYRYLTSRWRRPGMQRDLQAGEQEREAGIPGRWGGPGASARGRWAA